MSDTSYQQESWMVVGMDTSLASEDFAVTPQPLGQWHLAWRRFRRHPLALIGGCMVLVAVVLALIGPALSPVMPVVADFYRRAGLPPTAAVGADFFHENQPPLLWPFHWRYLMGTDALGIPVLAYTLLGFRPALELGVLGSLSASITGIIIGGIAGYFGGRLGALLMRLADAVLAVPLLPLLVLVSVFLTDRGVPVYVLLFGLAGWPSVARLAFSYCLSLREQEFVLAARALGVSDMRTIFRHMLPNMASVLVVSFTLNVALFIIVEANLDFLGAGLSVITWGGALANAYYSSAISVGYWWQVVFPMAALLFTTLGINFLGDGLSDALDVTRGGVLVDQISKKTGRTTRWIGWMRERAAVVIAPGLTLSHRLARSSALRAVDEWTSGLQRALVVGVQAIGHRFPIGEEGMVEQARQLSSPWLVYGPIVLAFLAVGLVFLYGHSPLNYAPNFPPPTPYAEVLGQSTYDAIPRPSGGWNLFLVDRRARLVFEQVDAQGRRHSIQLVAPHSSAGARPALAATKDHILGVWVSHGSLMGAWLGTRPLVPFVVTRGVIDHPFVIGRAHHFAVLFQQLHTGRSDIYQAWVPLQRGQPVRMQRLVRSQDVALYPRGAIDGSGALDLIYLERCCEETAWRIIFRCFDRHGRPLARPHVLDTVYYAPQSGRGVTLYGTVPPQWGLDMRSASDGSVWAAWSGNQALSISHWSRNGRPLLSPQGIGFVSPAEPLALVLVRDGGEVFTSYESVERTFIGAIAFDRFGRSSGAIERVNFEPGERSHNPQAGISGGLPAVVWQEAQSNGRTIVEGTTYRPAVPPDLATRFGLNIGSVWANMLLLVLGSLTMGLLFTVVNVPFVALTIVLSACTGRLFRGPLRWQVYTAVLSAALALTFAVPSTLPPFVIGLQGLIAPLEPLYRWLGVAGAVFVGYWIGHHLAREQEPLLRATAMALSALYFIAVMYAALSIQFEMGQV
jgi:ABC-type dipeptide/oligopeptide/nickel transport system permease subunit